MSEALQLADSAHVSHRVGWQRKAAAELRRLHAENEYLAGEVKNCTTNQMRTIDLISFEFRDLREKNAELVEALKWIGDHDLKGCDLVVAGHMAHGFIGRARAALAKVEAST